MGHKCSRRKGARRRLFAHYRSILSHRPLIHLKGGPGTNFEKSDKTAIRVSGRGENGEIPWKISKLWRALEPGQGGRGRIPR